MGRFKSNLLPHITLAPRGETSDRMVARERREAEARRVSDRIDQEIKFERAEMRKRQGNIKLLLLGQSESDKLTIIKNLKMKYAPAAWEKERASWRLVIQLNLIKTIITVIETLQAEIDNQPSPSASILQSPVTSNNAHAFTSSPDIIDSLAPPAWCGYGAGSLLTEKHQLLKLRLGPLRWVEEGLKRRLEARAEGAVLVEGMDSHPPSPRDALDNTKQPHRCRTSNSERRDGGEERGWDHAEDIIASCREDVMALWADESVRAMLKARGMCLGDSASFFLNDLERMTTQNYEPSDDDVFNASLRTSTVQEHKIRFENGSPQFLNLDETEPAHDLKEWVVYDIRRARTMRDAWEPYFDDANVIIFLAPISSFDEYLPEDPLVSRLEDAFRLWRAVCSSKLLSQATIFLFLNECDALKRKLEAGVRVRKYFPGYGDRPNEAAAVIEYLKEEFNDVLKDCSPRPRTSHVYAPSDTCVRCSYATAEASPTGIKALVATLKTV